MPNDAISADGGSSATPRQDVVGRAEFDGLREEVARLTEQNITLHLVALALLRSLPELSTMDLSAVQNKVSLIKVPDATQTAQTNAKTLIKTLFG